MSINQIVFVYRTNLLLNCLQFVATTIKNMLIIDLSLCYAFSGIVIPALTGIQNDHNLQETLTMTAVEASWFGIIIFFCHPFILIEYVHFIRIVIYVRIIGSISYIIQPIGSILASLVTGKLTSSTEICKWYVQISV